MIGLIIWAILIIFIAEAACPGLIWVILGTMVVYGALYALFVWVSNKFFNRNK